MLRGINLSDLCFLVDPLEEHVSSSSPEMHGLSSTVQIIVYRFPYHSGH